MAWEFWREGFKFTVVGRGVVVAASILLIMLGVFYFQMDKAGRAAPATDEEKEQLRRMSIAGVVVGPVILLWYLCYLVLWQSKLTLYATEAHAFRNWLPQLVSAGIASLLITMSAPWVEPKEDTVAPDIRNMAIASMCLGAVGAGAIAWVVLCSSYDEDNMPFALCGPELFRSMFNGTFNHGSTEGELATKEWRARLYKNTGYKGVRK